MRPNCVIFIFIWSWAAAQRSAAGTPCVPSLFTCFYLEEKNKRQPRHKHIGTQISFLLAPVGWTHRHIHMDVPVRENMGGLNMVTWRSGERRSWIGSAQATAEMNRERFSVCMPLDLISPTCPCHSDSQPLFATDASMAALNGLF